MARRTSRKNPETGHHPDLFGGESPIFVPLEELTTEQIMKLPRDAFRDDEWDQVDEDVRGYILQADPVSVLRREEVLDELKERADYILEPDINSALNNVEEEIEAELANRSATDLVDIAKGVDEDAVDRIVEEFSGAYSEPVAGVPEEVPDSVIVDKLGEVLADYNSYQYDLEGYDPYGRTSAMFVFPVRMSFYFDAWKDDWEKMHDDEIELVVEDFNSEGSYSNIGLEPEQLVKYFDERKRPRPYPYIDIYPEPDVAIYAYPRWDQIEATLREELDTLYLPAEGEEEEHLPPEERVALEFDDGFYVLDLQSAELPEEGKKQGMCVGDRDMGYIDEVRRGSTKIYSLRTKAGRPKLTFEVKMAHGEPVEVKQIKGKGNRLPGWDRGKSGQGKMKQDEVAKAIAFVDSLGIDPNDVYDLGPALRAMGKTGTKYDQVEAIMDELGIARRNPGGRWRRRSFDEPWRP